MSFDPNLTCCSCHYCRRWTGSSRIERRIGLVIADPPQSVAALAEQFHAAKIAVACATTRVAEARSAHEATHLGLERIESYILGRVALRASERRVAA